MGAETEVPRVRDFTVQHHCGRSLLVGLACFHETLSMYFIYVLGGWSTDMEVAVKELVGRHHKDVLRKMQRACLSATLNIARTFKLATH